MSDKPPVLQYAVATAIVLGVVFVLMTIVVNVITNDSMKAAGKRALRLQAPVEDTVFGKPIYATFERDEYANKSVVTCGDKTMGVVDLNKSKMLGHVVGEKSKQLLNGIWQGFIKKGKHSPGEGDKYGDN